MKKFSFPKKYRLLSKSDFDSRRARQKISQKDFLLLYRLNNKDYARLGIIVSKKNIAQAANRNIVKRMLRESFRHEQQKFSGIDIIIIARPQKDKIATAELRKGLESLWQKLFSQLKKSLLA